MDLNNSATRAKKTNHGIRENWSFFFTKNDFLLILQGGEEAAYLKAISNNRFL